MKLNLSKEETRSLVSFCLSKAGYENGVEAKVNIVLDGSGSMGNLYRNGTVSALVDRALAVGYRFDDDGSIDVFDFANGDRHRPLPQATQDDHGSYMQGKSMLGGGTAYGPVLERVEDFYYGTTEVVKKEGGIFGLFAKKTVTTEAAEGRDGMEDQFPVFTIFVTDGESLQQYEDSQVINRIMKERKDMFVQFVGIGSSSFNFLRQLDSKFENCGFVEVGDLGSISEEDLMMQILSEKAKNVLTK